MMDITRKEGNVFLLAHPESPLPVLKHADFVGSTKQMLDWVCLLDILQDYPARYSILLFHKDFPANGCLYGYNLTIL